MLHTINYRCATILQTTAEKHLFIHDNIRVLRTNWLSRETMWSKRFNYRYEKLGISIIMILGQATAATNTVIMKCNQNL